MEIGSFIEWQFPQGNEYYRGNTNIARLNSGRAGIYHAARCLYCSKVRLPRYLCKTVRDFLVKKGISLRYYDMNEKFEPILEDVPDEEAVVLTNYFGIMSDERMIRLAQRYSKVIIDNAQAFFARAIPGCMNVYSARKFIGVPDGAYVVGEGADQFIDEYEQDYSSDTSLFLLLRVEYGCAGKAYEARHLNEERVDQSDIKRMSGLTHSILGGTDYGFIKRKRRENFRMACRLLDRYNGFSVQSYISDNCVPMVYPLLTDNEHLIDALLAQKHFQGRWWAYLSGVTTEGSFENKLSRYLVPITIDQRYEEKELVFIADVVRQSL